MVWGGDTRAWVETPYFALIPPGITVGDAYLFIFADIFQGIVAIDILFGIVVVGRIVIRVVVVNAAESQKQGNVSAFFRGRIGRVLNQEDVVIKCLTGGFIASDFEIVAFLEKSPGGDVLPGENAETEIAFANADIGMDVKFVGLGRIHVTAQSNPIISRNGIFFSMGD